MLFVPYLSILENALMAITFQRENVVTNDNNLILKEQILRIADVTFLMSVFLHYVLSATLCYAHYVCHPLSAQILYFRKRNYLYES